MREILRFWPSGQHKREVAHILAGHEKSRAAWANKESYIGNGRACSTCRAQNACKCTAPLEAPRQWPRRQCTSRAAFHGKGAATCQVAGCLEKLMSLKQFYQRFVPQRLFHSI